MSTRQRIIETTAELLQHSPTLALSTRDICQAAGITAPTLYHHFGDKETLFDAVAAYGFERFLNGKPSPVDSVDSVEVLTDAWDDHVRFGVTRPKLYMLMFSNDRSDADSPAVRESRALIAGVLARIAGAGRLRLDVEQAALVVEAALIGVTVQAIRGGQIPDVSDHVRDAVLGSLVYGYLPDADDPSLAGAAEQLAHRLTGLTPECSPLKPVESALLAEWLRLLAATGRSF
jgi:AcrR family transcriptional regulator